ncbi:helix-turn-helix domain-containing protein [Streptomyces sp. NPDC001054]
METTPKVGKIGQRVAAEVARLRGRVTVRELSARLEELGRPILPSGISKIEHGLRRVDVDDLVALAMALEVTPNRLLFGRPLLPDDQEWKKGAHADIYIEDEDEGFPLLPMFPGYDMDPWEVWEWAVGMEAMGPAWEHVYIVSPSDQDKFRMENRPLLFEREPERTFREDLQRLVTTAFREGVTAAEILTEVANEVMAQRPSSYRSGNDGRRRSQEDTTNRPARPTEE